MDEIQEQLNQAIAELMAHTHIEETDPLEAGIEENEEIEATAPSNSLCASPKPSKEHLTPSTVSTRVSESAAPCVKKEATVCRTHVSDRVSGVWRLPSRYAAHPVYRHMVDPTDADDTITNLCVTAMQARNPESVLHGMLRELRIDLLFGPGDWAAKTLDQFRRMRERRVGSGSALLLYPFIGAIRERVMPEQLVVRGRSKLTVPEAAFVAKTITNKVVERWHRFRQPCAEISNTYFLEQGFPTLFKKVTGRNIGRSRHKIAAITSLLDACGVVEKTEQWDHEAHRRERNLYRLGPNNPYADRIASGAPVAGA